MKLFPSCTQFSLVPTDSLERPISFVSSSRVSYEGSQDTFPDPFAEFQVPACCPAAASVSSTPPRMLLLLLFAWPPGTCRQRALQGLRSPKPHRRSSRELSWSRKMETGGSLAHLHPGERAGSSFKSPTLVSICFVL